MSYYNSDLDAFTFYHYLPSNEKAQEASLPALGQALSGSVGSAIANLAVYPLDVVVKRLQVQRALSRRPETKRERDKRLERERLEKDKEEALLAYSQDPEEDEKEERERVKKIERRARREREKERRERKEKGMGMVFDADNSNGQVDAYGNRLEGRNGRLGKQGYDKSTGSYRGFPSVMDGGGVAEKVRNQLLEERKQRARGSLHGSDVWDDDDDDDYAGSGIIEVTEEKKWERHKVIEDHKDLEGYFTEGDEVEEEENYTGVADAFEKIYDKEGLKGLYTGVVEDTVNTIGHGIWYFATYSFLRQQRLKHLPPHTTSLPVLEELSVGILAGAISKFFTTPIANVVTRKQTAIYHTRAHEATKRKKTHDHEHKKKHKHKSPSTVSIIQDIYDEHGAAGFWAGYKPALLLTMNPAITFLLYELLKKGLPKKHRGRQTKSQTFLLGALAKAVASTVTYPLAVVKTRSMIKTRKKMEGSVRRKGRTSTDSASSTSSSSSSDSSCESSSGSESDNEGGSRRYKLRYKLKYKKKLAKYRKNKGGTASGMRAVAKEIWKTEGIKGFYVGLWAEVLKGFFANGISMLIKETIFHTLTSMYLLVLRARNRSEDRSIAGTMSSLGQEIYERIATKQRHAADKADNVVRGAEGLIERGKERWNIGKEKIIRGITGSAGGTVGGVLRSHNTEGEEITRTTTTTTTVTEKIMKQDLNGNGNATVNVDVTSPRRMERSNSVEMIKRKLQMRDAGRERVHEGTIHDGTLKFGRNHPNSPGLEGAGVIAATTAAAPVISGITDSEKIQVPSINTRERVACWLEKTEKEGLGMGAIPTPLPPPPPPPVIPIVPSYSSPPGAMHLNTPFTPHGKGNGLESSRIANGGLRTSTFDVTKSRNIMDGGSFKRSEAREHHVNWEGDGLNWKMRR
ncbi:mitochondrial carrier domain-containing protein [Kalaharituber pfeilii]|nr:mitochondrial carrier domain-containing protein [Kalaharituber pfeilii]